VGLLVERVEIADAPGDRSAVVRFRFDPKERVGAMSRVEPTVGFPEPKTSAPKPGAVVGGQIVWIPRSSSSLSGCADRVMRLYNLSIA
jgi:hypothetical protein